jgi:hypothetical protein
VGIQLVDTSSRGTRRHGPAWCRRGLAGACSESAFNDMYTFLPNGSDRWELVVDCGRGRPVCASSCRERSC